VWVRWWWAWAIPALVLTANLVWLVGLRGGVVGRGTLIERRVSDLQRDVARLQADKRRLIEAQAKLGTLRDELTSLRQEQLAPMRERLVPFLIDVVERSRQASLTPERIGYSYSQEKKSGLVHFNAAYAVTGPYDRIRRLVYLLESSPQFVVIERLGLTGNDDAASLDVRVQLTLGTYFSDIDEQLLEELGVTEVSSGEGE